MIGGPSTKMPRSLSSFLHNCVNKQQLIHFLLSEWSKASYGKRLLGRSVFFVCEDKCIQIQSADGLSVSATEVDELCSNHEEADTRIILHCMYAVKHQNVDREQCIVVKSPDTDVFVLLLAYQHLLCNLHTDVLFETGTGDKHRFLSVRKHAAILGNVTQALPGLHAFTGCDSTSAFVHKGKKRPLSIMRRRGDFVKAFSDLGTDASRVDDSLLSVLQEFVCSMYSSYNVSDVNKVRSTLFRARYSIGLPQSMLSPRTSGIDLSLLPPCRSSLVKHVLRANYQTYVWKHADHATIDIPSPVGCGWTTDDANLLHVDWTDGDIIPNEVVDVLADSTCISGDSEDVEEDDVVDNILDYVFDDDDDEDNF